VKDCTRCSGRMSSSSRALGALKARLRGLGVRPTTGAIRFH